MDVAALFVEPDGCYANLPGVDAWPEERDARIYRGPHPVVAHPPCQRWGRFWHGSTRKPHQFKLGEDGGCFAAALAAVCTWGGVLEHPADSHAWAHFGLNRPVRGGGWIAADFEGGWTCYVEQGHYGHFSRKPTWLYACKVDLPELEWSRLPQRLHPVALERYGYEKARRIGVMAMVGGKDKTKIRNATPEPFRDLLLAIARTVARPGRESSPLRDSGRPASDGNGAGAPSRHPTSPCAPAMRQTAARSCGQLPVQVGDHGLDRGKAIALPEMRLDAGLLQQLAPCGIVIGGALTAEGEAVGGSADGPERRDRAGVAADAPEAGDELEGARDLHVRCSVAVSNNLSCGPVAVNNNMRRMP